MSSASSDESLSASFYRLQRAASTEGARSAADSAALITSLQTLMTRIESASLFSANEEADDLPTSSLKYLLTPYLLAQAEASCPSPMAERLAHLTQAVQMYQAFVRRIDAYRGLVDDKPEIDACKLAVKAFHDKLKSSAAGANEPAPRPVRPADPNAARNAKIARFKREKEISSQLAAMQQTRRSASRGNVVGSHAASDDSLDEESIDSALDESAVRSFYKLLFHSAVLSSVSAVKSAVEELDMLKHHRDVELQKPRSEQLQHMNENERAAAMRAQPPSGPNGGKPVMFKMTPESLMQPIPDSMKHLLQSIAPPAYAAAAASSAVSSASAASAAAPVPSTVANRIDSLVAARSDARSDVFKLTNQPTYSIEQWADAEIAAGRLPGPSNDPQPRGPDPRRIRSAHDRDVAQELVEEFQRTQVEDSDELEHEDGSAGRAKDEMKTMKDRSWDDWADDHQKGVGNTMK